MEAFYSCDALQETVIPKSVKEIESYAFGGNSSLEKVYYQGSKDEWISIEKQYTGLENTTIVLITVD